jgi:hypothetical protein
MKSKLIIALALSVGVLAGCGGGGSSGSGGGSSTQAKVSISTTNQSTIANTAINSAAQSVSGSGLSLVGGVQTTGTPIDDHVLNKLADFAFNKIAEHESTPLSVTGVTTVVSPNPCTSGNITYDTDGTSANNYAYTYFTVSYNNCVSGTGSSAITQSGTVSLSNLTITKNGSAITGISATFTFNWTISNASNTAGIYGGFTIASTGINSISRRDSISGTSLNFKLNAQYETLSNFAFVSTYNNTITPHGYSDTVDYSFASDVILAGFDFHTVIPLVRTVVTGVVQTYPSSGQVVISGANSTRLRVTLLATSGSNVAGTSSGLVSLELDQGTGTYGTAVNRTWAQLALGQ